MRAISLTLVLLAAAPAAAQAPPTLRLDYHHTGGPGVEVFSVDRLVVEPAAWSGARRLDPGDAGIYRFEVRDTIGRVLYRQGFSSIFHEWMTTAEARRQNRTFHESLRFPGGHGVVDVVVQHRDPHNAFREVWRTRVDPADPYVDRSRPRPQQVLEIERHGDPAQKVDVLLIGDGYTAAECASKFGPGARRMAAALFAEEPFRGRRADFNVWGICPPAAESGVSRPSTGQHRASPVGSTYDVFGAERYVLTYDNRALREVAAWAPYDFVTVLVNSETYGGGGIHGQFSTVAVDSEWADYLFVHEFAHHFAGLADEYYTSPAVYEAPAEVVEPWEPNVTALLDPSALKWGGRVAAGTPVPTPWPKDAFEALQAEIQARRREIRAQRRPEAEMNALFREERTRVMAMLSEARFAGRVGAFQGANYDARAFYRPEIDCIMFSRNPVGFCEVCRRALAAVIDRLVAAA